MIDQQLQECIKSAHKAGLQNAEQLSRDSVLIRFVQLCSWYSQIQKERDNLLEALERLRDAEKEPRSEWKLAIANADIAIAKAKGEAQ